MRSATTRSSLSLPQDRPANATDTCGVAWMNWGTTGDGYTRPRSTMLVLRNLTTTAHPAFRERGAEHRHPGDGQTDDGRLPTHRDLHHGGQVPKARLPDRLKHTASADNGTAGGASNTEAPPAHQPTTTKTLRVPWLAPLRPGS